MGIFRKIFGRSEAAPSQKLSNNMQDLKRNDPCWCGSGVKYKKCHMDEDKKRLSEALKTRAVGACDAFS